MINGIMTLSGAWHKLRDDPHPALPDRVAVVLRHVDIRRPMMSIKTVNALSHYTDWTVGHVHSGALGWVGLITMGSLYYLVPRLFGGKKCIRSRRLKCTSGWPPLASFSTSPPCGLPV